jgi:hypothetical protein
MKAPTKPELQARAKELGVAFVTRDNVETLSAKIGVAERAEHGRLGEAIADVLGGADPVVTADAVVAKVKATRALKKTAPKGKAKAAVKPSTKKAAPKVVAGDVNPAVVRLIEAQQDGSLRAAIDAAGIKVGTLARQEGITPGVASKLVHGTRVPRATAAPDSNPGKLAAWLDEVTK